MILRVDDPYTAYCLDEACLYIMQQMRDGKTPRFAGTVQSNNDSVQALLAQGGVMVD